MSVRVCPTSEKSLSDCAELAEIHRMRRATSDRSEKSVALSCQKRRGVLCLAGTRTALQRASSSLPDVTEVEAAGVASSRRAAKGTTYQTY